MSFSRVRIDRAAPALDDVAAAVDATLAECGVALAPGSTVAIAAGSRGIANLPVVISRVIAWARAQGAEPFLVPAMGSHGGATAAGQAEVLASYGLAALGVPIRATMDVVSLPADDCPVPVVFDANAAVADATILVNRVKPHTDFHGPVESGLIKMAAIGLGKQVQADCLHTYGTYGLRSLMPLVGRQVLRHGNIVLGVGLVENSADRTMHVEAIPAARLEAEEPRLLSLALANLPSLPIDEIDVLLVDRMGKDISGVGMDTNVIGRIMIAGEPDAERPRIAMIGCHELTPASHGNACGMGLADIVTRRFADSVDHDVTRTNIVTSGFLLRGKLPVVADDAVHLWELCLRGGGVVDRAGVRAIRIVDTLHCDELWVSDALLAEVLAVPGAVLEASGLALHEGRELAPFR